MKLRSEKEQELRDELACLVREHRTICVYYGKHMSLDWRSYKYHRQFYTLEHNCNRLRGYIQDVSQYFREEVSQFRDEVLLSACGSIDICVNFTNDEERLKKIIQGIARVGRAERVGNGEYSEEETLKLIEKASISLQNILKGKE